MAEFGCDLATCGIDTCGDGLPCTCQCHRLLPVKLLTHMSEPPAPHITDNMNRAGKLLYKLRRIYGCAMVDEIVDEAIAQREQSAEVRS